MAKYQVKLKARLVLIQEGEILLLKQTKPNGGNYTLPGGTIEEEEFARDALIREAREEVGIHLHKEDLKLAFVAHKKSGTKHRIVFYFQTNIYSGRPQSREHDKFSKFVWSDLQDLPEKLTPTVRKVIRRLRAGKQYTELAMGEH
ncbi:MAG: NUDIX domain-containing protein [Bacteroidota bacterium]